MEALHTRCNSPFNCKIHQRRSLQKKRERFWLEHGWTRVVHFSPVCQRTVRQKSPTSFSLQWSLRYAVFQYFQKQCHMVDLLLSWCIWHLMINRTEDELGQNQTDSHQFVLFSRHPHACVSGNICEIFRWRWMSSWCFWSHILLSLHLCHPIITASRKSVVWKVDWQNIEEMEINSSTDRRLAYEKSFTWKCYGQSLFHQLRSPAKMSWNKMQQSVCASLAKKLVVYVLLAFQNNLRRNTKDVQPYMFQALRFRKQEKRFAALFPTFSKCALRWWYLCYFALLWQDYFHYCITIM